MTEEIKAGTKCVEVTYMRAFKVWWSLLWRSALFTFLMAAVGSFTIGFILRIDLLAPANTIKKIVCQALFFIIGLLVNIAIMRIVLKKRYSDFRIALIEE